MSSRSIEAVDVPPPVGLSSARAPVPARALHAETGGHLRRLRESRGLSQLSLALSAGVSMRHLSFVETGRARPGCDVLLRLGAALDLTHDELRALLAAAGYGAPLPPSHGATASQLAPVLGRIRSVLEGVDPLPAVLVDARWDLLMANTAYVRLERALLRRPSFTEGPLRLTMQPRPNRIRELLHPPEGTRVLNRREVLAVLLRQVELDARSSGDPVLRALLEEARASVGITDASSREPFPLRVELRAGRHVLRLYSLVTCWATEMPGLRVEVLHPVDETSERVLRRLVGAA